MTLRVANISQYRHRRLRRGVVPAEMVKAVAKTLLAHVVGGVEVVGP